MLEVKIGVWIRLLLLCCSPVLAFVHLMSKTCLVLTNACNSPEQMSNYLTEHISPCEDLQLEDFVHSSFVQFDIATATDEAHCETAGCGVQVVGLDCDESVNGERQFQKEEVAVRGYSENLLN
jgi:hypothetical protein